MTAVSNQSTPIATALFSWSDGPARQSIVDLVSRVTTPGGADFVPVPDRIAVFDNDGTLWCESPLPVRLAFALDRVHALAPQQPEWKDLQPFKGVLENDMKAAVVTGMAGLAGTGDGHPHGQFEQIVRC
jgi:hypothetical protein